MPLIVLRTKTFEGLEQPTFVPSGTYTITQTGTFNIANYEYAKIAIPLRVKNVYVSSSTTWVLMSDGSLWGCGRNNSGQQGTSDTSSNTLVFTQRLTDVKQVACSSTTTWALKTDGTLWGCGSNSYKQQGSNSTTNVIAFTQRLTDVKQVICSSQGNETWAIKTDNSLWGCGANGVGQQSNGSSGVDVGTFTQRLTDVIQFISSGNSTSWALKSDGTLWGCGYNGSGQQGNNQSGENIVETFTKRLEDVKSFSCQGGNTTFAVKTDGTLWGCGANGYGQQGEPNYPSIFKTFGQRFTDVDQVVCSSNTTWVIRTDGTLWGCGQDSNGQQGSGSYSQNKYVYPFTQRLTDIKQVVCTDAVTWAIKTDNSLWGCGINTYGQQGSGDTNSVATFTKRLEDVKHVDCRGGNTTFAVKTDGTLWGCGRNNYGQQGSGDENNVLTFTERILL